MGYVVSTADLTAYLAELKACRTAILQGKTYSINGRSLSHVSEEWVTKEINKTISELSQRTTGMNTTPVFINSRG